MFRLFNTPVWFHGWDIMVEAVILLVVLLIAAYSWRIYKFNNENRFAYFSLAFIFLALGLLFEMLTSGIVYFTPVRDVAADVLRPVAGPRLVFSGLLYRGGFFLQMAPILGAWLLIFFISQKPRERLRKFYELSQIALFVYLILLISIVSNFKYFVFYLTSAVLLGLIVLNYYKNYLENNNQHTYRIMLAFLLILASNILLVFVFLVPSLYVLGEIVALAGFLLLLYTYNSITAR